MSAIFALFVAALLAAGFTALYLPFAGRLGWIDAPNERSSHARPTLSSGGMGVCLALALTLALSSATGYWAVSGREWLALTAVMGACLLGAWDDRQHLSVGLRLGVQLLLAAIVAQAYGFSLTEGIGSALLVLALAWLMNLYNFMDGIDGLAALQCTLAAGGFALLGSMGGASADFKLAALAVAGVYLGFLVFNWPPARLFMGDAGSLSAGLLLGWLGIWGWTSGWLSPARWLLLMSPFIIDTGITLARRALRREPLGQAHRSHYYQRLARHWDSHRRVDLKLLALHLVWLLPLAITGAAGFVSPWALLVPGLIPQLVHMAKGRALE